MTVAQPAGAPGIADPDFTQSEFPFTPLDFVRIAEIMAADCGIVLEAGKMPLVYSRLAKRLRLLGVRTFRQYCALVSSDAGADERRRMVETLTTNITRFFVKGTISTTSGNRCCPSCWKKPGVAVVSASGPPAVRAARKPIRSGSRSWI